MALSRGGPLLQVFWSYMDTDSVGEAVWSLSQAVGCKPENVGFLDLVSGEYWCRTVDEHVDDIRAWALRKKGEGEGIEVVVWNDLKPDFEKKARRELTPENVVSYMRNLRPETKEQARHYLESLPPGIETPVLAAVRDDWSNLFSAPNQPGNM